MYNILFGGRRKKFQVNCAETTYKVHYLGNVMTSLLKSGMNETGKALVRRDDDADDDDVHDDDYLERLAAGDDEVEISCVDKPVRILWENHLKNSGSSLFYLFSGGGFC